jgi:hypothetical protein
MPNGKKDHATQMSRDLQTLRKGLDAGVDAGKKTSFRKGKVDNAPLYSLIAEYSA